MCNLSFVDHFLPTLTGRPCNEIFPHALKLIVHQMTEEHRRCTRRNTHYAHVPFIHVCEVRSLLVFLQFNFSFMQMCAFVTDSGQILSNHTMTKEHKTVQNAIRRREKEAV